MLSAKQRSAATASPAKHSSFAILSATNRDNEIGGVMCGVIRIDMGIAVSGFGFKEGARVLIRVV